MNDTRYLESASLQMRALVDVLRCLIRDASAVEANLASARNDEGSTLTPNVLNKLYGIRGVVDGAGASLNGVIAFVERDMWTQQDADVLGPLRATGVFNTAIPFGQPGVTVTPAPDAASKDDAQAADRSPENGVQAPDASSKNGVHTPDTSLEEGEHTPDASSPHAAGGSTSLSRPFQIPSTEPAPDPKRIINFLVESQVQQPVLPEARGKYWLPATTPPPAPSSEAKATAPAPSSEAKAKAPAPSSEAKAKAPAPSSEAKATAPGAATPGPSAPGPSAPAGRPRRPRGGRKRNERYVATNLINDLGRCALRMNVPMHGARLAFLLGRANLYRWHVAGPAFRNMAWDVLSLAHPYSPFTTHVNGLLSQWNDLLLNEDPSSYAFDAEDVEYYNE